MYFKERYMKSLILLIGFMCIFNISYGNMKPKIKMREYTMEEKKAYLEKAIRRDEKTAELIRGEFKKVIDLLGENNDNNYFEIVRKINTDMTDSEIIEKELGEWLEIIKKLANFEDDVETFGYERALNYYESEKN